LHIRSAENGPRVIMLAPGAYCNGETRMNTQFALLQQA
jgi:hypothetical protein